MKGLRDCYLLGFSGCEFPNSSRSLRSAQSPPLQGGAPVSLIPKFLAV